VTKTLSHLVAILFVCARRRHHPVVDILSLLLRLAHGAARGADKENSVALAGDARRASTMLGRVADIDNLVVCCAVTARMLSVALERLPPAASGLFAVERLKGLLRGGVIVDEGVSARFTLYIHLSLHLSLYLHLSLRLSLYLHLSLSLPVSPSLSLSCFTWLMRGVCGSASLSDPRL
jgi:hypothetical protein